MSPVATDTRPVDAQAPLKNGTNGVTKKQVDTFAPSDLEQQNSAAAVSSFNPFYSPPGDADKDETYEYDKYKVRVQR